MQPAALQSCACMAVVSAALPGCSCAVGRAGEGVVCAPPSLYVYANRWVLQDSVVMARQPTHTRRVGQAAGCFAPGRHLF